MRVKYHEIFSFIQTSLQFILADLLRTLRTVEGTPASLSISVCLRLTRSPPQGCDCV